MWRLWVVLRDLRRFDRGMMISEKGWSVNVPSFWLIRSNLGRELRS